MPTTQAQTRRQTIAQLALAAAALVLTTPILRRLLPARPARRIAATVGRGHTPSARRVQPAPHSVHRHG